MKKPKSMFLSISFWLKVVVLFILFSSITEAINSVAISFVFYIIIFMISFALIMLVESLERTCHKMELLNQMFSKIEYDFDNKEKETKETEDDYEQNRN